MLNICPRLSYGNLQLSLYYSSNPVALTRQTPSLRRGDRGCNLTTANNDSKHMDCMWLLLSMSWTLLLIVPFTTSKIVRQVETQYSKFYTQSTVTMGIIRCSAERGALSGA